MNPKANFFFEKAKKWHDEVHLLRSIILDCKVVEEVKWGCPCYMADGANIVLMHTFKDYCAILFFKGALLKDADNVLIQQTANVQAARQMRFTDLQSIKKSQKLIKTYIREAIEIERAGLKVEMKKTEAFPMPEEFASLLSKNARLKKAFYALTPGRQRGYLLHFGSAKQAKTRVARIEKNIDRILEGLGLED